MAPAIIFRQMFEKESSTYTYLLGCPVTKECLLIDPVLETVDRDLKLICELGLNLKLAINTHCHADHITGTGAFKSKVPGLKSGISRASEAKADCLYHPGDVVTVGETVSLQALATPGHTAGCMSFYFDGVRGTGTDGGGMVFTGDALLIRGCGRTDFQGGDSALLYKSVHEQLFTLPDETVVYPAHDYKGFTRSTIGEEKAHNPRLSRECHDFVDFMAGLGLPYPKQIDKAVPANLKCGLQWLPGDGDQGVAAV